MDKHIEAYGYEVMELKSTPSYMIVDCFYEAHGDYRPKLVAYDIDRGDWQEPEAIDIDPGIWWDVNDQCLAKERDGRIELVSIPTGKVITTVQINYQCTDICLTDKYL